VGKTRVSAFSATELAPRLLLRGIDTLPVTGCTMSGCARASEVDAMSWSLRPIVVRDAVGDRAPGPHEASPLDMGQRYADLVTCEEALASLDRIAA
jgi:maleamate amidohydrolase